jgi:two-component system response regulator
MRHEPPFVNVPTPALILLDLNIPRPDGRAILILLCRLAAYQKTPVVIIMEQESHEEAPCLQLGAIGYVQKSTDFASYFGGIRATLRDWLGHD